MEHRNCALVKSLMEEEVIRLEQIISIYRSMLLTMNVASLLLDEIEDEAYNKPL